MQYFKSMLVLGITILVLSISLGTSLAQKYNPADCTQIQKTISAIESSKSNYTNLTMYSYYSRLADKYNQLGECYQDINQSSTSAFEKAGYYYKLAAKYYITDFTKKYAYLMSSGDSYASAGDKENALIEYREAKQILEEHPEIHITTKVVNEKITNLLNSGKVQKLVKTKNAVWVVGVVIFILVLGGVIYIVKRY